MLLAQTSEAWRDVFFWLGLIVAAAVVLGIGALVLRKLLIRQDEASPIGFTLADLRQMYEDGELSPEEFDQAKGRMLAQNRAMLDDADEEDG